jgi:hypothetical protein
MYTGLMILHTAEPLVPEPNVFEVEMAIEKRKKKQESPGIEKNPNRVD